MHLASNQVFKGRCAAKPSQSSVYLSRTSRNPFDNIHETMSLPIRKIGSTDVTAMGYGAMGIAAYYGAPLPDEDRYKVSGF